MKKMLSLKITYMVTLSGLLVSFAPPCEARRGVCPGKWFTAQFVALVDVIIPEKIVPPVPDMDITFFQDIMLFSDTEIEKVTQFAMEFFNRKFGLDFSQSSCTSEGKRTCCFCPLHYITTINVNSWLLSGKIFNFCFENQNCG